ncbi:MAG: SemiSWEET transporter [Verrucomicrobiota bacterium JB023]|nr:SemiSWEET transporter [Verrucomicrobiota bacterium JB023]
MAAASNSNRAEWLDYLGYVAALLSTGAFLPQAVKTIRTRETRGISLGMYVIFTAGVTLWLIYAIGIGSVPMTLANTVTVLLAVIILILKLRHG